jgi:hypothetical protein
MSVETLIDADSFRATASGFTCRYTGRLREFHDEDVASLRIHKQRIVSDDGVARTREWLSIQVADPAVPPVEVDAEYSGPDDNFLADFRNRLLDSLTERSLAALLHESRFDGGPWIISLDGLTDKSVGTRIHLDRISGLAWQAGRLCFSQKGSNQLAMSFPSDAENTYLLARLASKLLHFNVDSGSGPEADPSREAYQFRDTSFRVQTAMGIAFGGCLLLAYGALKLAVAKELIIAAGLGVAAAVTLIATGLAYWQFGTPAILRLSGKALSLVHRRKESILPLDNLAEYSAHWSDYYRNGVYQQTLVRFQFTSDDAFLPTFRYDSQASRGTAKFEELQRFQSHLASIIAHRMQAELASSGRISWTARLTLLPYGLEFTRKPTDEPLLIAFSQITHWELDQGLLKLAIEGSRKPDIVENTTEPNFYPGLVVFTQLFESR